MLKSRLKSFLSNILLEDLTKNCVNELDKKVVPYINSRISELSGIKTELIEIRSGKTSKYVKGITHEKFDTVLRLVNSDIPVYLSGEAGTGKNVICKQVAEALGLEFYFTNAVTQEYKLTGFIDANGTYHETEFYKAFKNGGLFFLDELDASIPEVLVSLNAAIANRYFDFPTGKIEANKNFRLIAAGNTVGTGSDRVYSGRYCLDGASLDRFVLVHIPYSKKIEEFITGNDRSLLKFCYAYRRAVKDSGINSIFSYRGLSSISKLKDELPLAKVLEICLVKGMEKDDLKMLQSAMTGNVDNKYFIAFNSL